MPLVGSRSSQPCSGPSQAPTQACDWSAPRRRRAAARRAGADVAGHVARRQAEPAQRADHQMGEVLAHAFATPQHLGDRRAGGRHAGAEGEVAPDPGVQVEHRLQHRPAEARSRAPHRPGLRRRPAHADCRTGTRLPARPRRRLPRPAAPRLPMAALPRDRAGQENPHRRSHRRSPGTPRARHRGTARSPRCRNGRVPSRRHDTAGAACTPALQHPLVTAAAAAADAPDARRDRPASDSRSASRGARGRSRRPSHRSRGRLDADGADGRQQREIAPRHAIRQIRHRIAQRAQRAGRNSAATDWSAASPTARTIACGSSCSAAAAAASEVSAPPPISLSSARMPQAGTPGRADCHRPPAAGRAPAPAATPPDSGCDR